MPNYKLTVSFNTDDDDGSASKFEEVVQAIAPIFLNSGWEVNLTQDDLPATLEELAPEAFKETLVDWYCTYHGVRHYPSGIGMFCRLGPLREDEGQVQPPRSVAPQPTPRDSYNRPSRYED